MEPLDYAELTTLAYATMASRSVPTQWPRAFGAALEKRIKARAQAQAKATTCVSAEGNTPSWRESSNSKRKFSAIHRH